jgi:hypothetical protein
MASVIVAQLEALRLTYPAVSDELRANLAGIRKELKDCDPAPGPAQAIPV